MPVRQQRARVPKTRAAHKTPPKEALIAVRLDGDEARDLRAAAKRMSLAVSVFVRSVAVQEARRILAA